jgi:hypothetical protein
LARSAPPIPVLGGGADITGGDTGVRLSQDGPQKNHWVAAAREVSGSWSLRSWAVCAPQPKGYEADRVMLVWTTLDTAREAVPYAIVGVLLVPALAYLAGLVAAAQAAVARRLLWPIG